MLRLLMSPNCYTTVHKAELEAISLAEKWGHELGCWEGYAGHPLVHAVATCTWCDGLVQILGWWDGRDEGFVVCGDFLTTACDRPTRRWGLPDDDPRQKQAVTSMDAEHVGQALGRQRAESDLRRSGIAVASDLATRAAALRDWEALGHLLTAGSQEVEAFIRAFVAGYRSVALAARRLPTAR